MDYQPQKPRKPRRNSTLLNKFQRARLSVLSVGVICVVILLMGVSVAGRIDQDIEYLYDQLDKADDMVFEQERDILRLSEQVRLASTDQFIASEARTKYGYLFPGEIRFVVTNPEVLGLPPKAPEQNNP